MRCSAVWERPCKLQRVSFINGQLYCDAGVTIVGGAASCGPPRGTGGPWGPCGGAATGDQLAQAAVAVSVQHVVRLCTRVPVQNFKMREPAPIEHRDV